MENYFNHKSVADLIDSVVNGKGSEEKVSLEKVLAFDGLVDPFTTEFRCDNCYAKFKEQFKTNKGRAVVIC